MSTLTIDNQKLAYEVTGSGKPVLLVHGFPLNREMWRDQIDALANSHMVIAPDLRGFGESDPPVGDVSMKVYANDLAALLDHLSIDQPVAIVGFSMGGYVTFEFWRRHKERVASMMLIDTRADPDSSEKAVSRRDAADRVEKEGINFLIDGMMPNLVADQTFKGQPDVVKALRTMMAKSSTAGVIGALHAMANRPDSRDTLADIDVPTAVIVGTEDAISPPADMEQIAQSLKTATFTVIADAGHMTTMENSAALTEAMKKHLSA